MLNKLNQPLRSNSLLFAMVPMRNITAVMYHYLMGIKLTLSPCRTLTHHQINKIKRVGKTAVMS